MKDKDDYVSVEYIIMEMEDGIDALERQKLYFECIKKFGWKFVRDTGDC